VFRRFKQFKCPVRNVLRFPDLLTMTQDGGKVVSLKHRPHFTPRKYSWYSFLLEAESRPQGHSAIRRIYVNEKFHDTIWDRTSDLLICSAVNPSCSMMLKCQTTGIADSLPRPLLSRPNLYSSLLHHLLHLQIQSQVTILIMLP
jgi:hypothetical protein